MQTEQTRAAGKLELGFEKTRVQRSLKMWVRKQAPLKTLSAGHVAAYVVVNWERLNRSIDNAAKRGKRGRVLHRQNQYGSKSEGATEVRAANIVGIPYHLGGMARHGDVSEK